MKKNLLLFILCIVISTLSFGQFKIIAVGGNTALNSDTVKVYGNSTDEMEVTFNVVNQGFDTVSVYARRDSISTPPHFDSNNTFCWVLCFSFGGPYDVSSFGETLNQSGSPGDTSTSSFIGYYKALGHLGAAYIRYTFFAARLHADSAWVMVEYDATPTGVQNISSENTHFSAYPNPANTFVNFNYSLSSGVQAANLKIYNLLGECVQTLPLSTLKNKTSVDVQSMPFGIYVCEIQANGCQPVYQKLVVSH